MKTHLISQAVNDVVAERQRQRDAEGWTAEHDDYHQAGTLAQAATAYAWSAIGELAPSFTGPRMNAHVASRKFGWPWDAQWWKPRGPRRDLVRAAALIIAELERMDRALPPAHSTSEGEQS